MALSDLIPKLLDSYDRQARLYPGLLVLAPLAVLLVALYGSANILATSVLTILGFCGGAYALGRVARDAGKRIQDDMFRKWGGAPSTQLLRLRDSHFDVHTKERYHRTLAKCLGKTFPDRETENADPAAADELYRAGALWVINATRDAKAFPLVFKENVAFGFHRNTFGLRRLGIAVALISVFWALLHGQVFAFKAPYFTPAKLGEIQPPVLISIVVSCAMLVVWFALFNEAALRRVGFSYAERLLQSCDSIKGTAPRGAKKNAGDSKA